MTWATCEFGQIAELSNKRFDPIRGENRPCIELEHIDQGTGQLLGQTNSNQQISMKNVFRQGNILFGKLRPYLRKYWFCEFDGVCSSEVWVLSPKPKVTDNKFLFYLIQTEKFIQATNVSSGSKMPRADWEYVSAFTFDIPPLPEQRKIAEILGTWDEAIRLTAELIAAKQQRKKGLMQRLLTGEVRFPEFAGRPWIVETFGNVLNIQIGRTPSRSQQDYWDHARITSNVWLSIADLKEKYIYDSKEYLSDVGVSASNSKLIPSGTVVMSFKLTIGRAAILRVPAYTNEAICALTPKNKNRVTSRYLFHALSIVDFEKEIDQAVKGKTLNTSKLENLELPLPDFAEQLKIADLLDACDDEINLLQQKHTALQQQKKGLMQRLLTGEVRVKV